MRADTHRVDGHHTHELGNARIEVTSVGGLDDRLVHKRRGVGTGRLESSTTVVTVQLVRRRKHHQRGDILTELLTRESHTPLTRLARCRQIFERHLDVLVTIPAVSVVVLIEGGVEVSLDLGSGRVVVQAPPGHCRVVRFNDIREATDEEIRQAKSGKRIARRDAGNFVVLTADKEETTRSHIRNAIGKRLAVENRHILIVLRDTDEHLVRLLSDVQKGELSSREIFLVVRPQGNLLHFLTYHICAVVSAGNISTQIVLHLDVVSSLLREVRLGRPLDAVCMGIVGCVRAVIPRHEAVDVALRVLP